MCATGHANAHSVEEGLAYEHSAAFAHGRGETRRMLVDALGNLREPRRAVISRVHGCDVGKQDLRGADVARSLFASDVLLSSLQRQSICGLTVGIHTYADETPRHAALEPGTHRHEARMGPTEPEGNTEPLRRTDNDIGAHFARRFQHCHGQQVRRDDRQRTQLMRSGHKRCQISNGATGPGVTHDHTCERTLRPVFTERSHHELHADGFRSSSKYRERLRVCVRIHEHTHRLSLPNSERHCFRHSGGFI